MSCLASCRHPTSSVGRMENLGPEPRTIGDTFLLLSIYLVITVPTRSREKVPRKGVGWEFKRF